MHRLTNFMVKYSLYGNDGCSRCKDYETDGHAMSFYAEDSIHAVNQLLDAYKDNSICVNFIESVESMEDNDNE